MRGHNTGKERRMLSHNPGRETPPGEINDRVKHPYHKPWNIRGALQETRGALQETRGALQETRAPPHNPGRETPPGEINDPAHIRLQ